MASITSAGIGSGLDISGLVTKLVAAEGDPATQRLNTQEAQLQARLSALGTLKGALSDFQGAVTGLKSLSAFQSVTAASSNTAVFTASATSTAGAGSHSITVSSLAQIQKLASAAFADTTSAVGTGVLTFQFGTFSGGVFTPNAAKAAQTVTISEADNSLQGIRDAVNKANIGVTASIVNDGTGNRLVFSAADTGAANSIKITVSEDDGDNLDNSGLSQLAYDPAGEPGAGKNLIETMAALDAQLTVDGLPITSASNTVTGAIEGVTLSLLSAPAAGNSGTLTIATNKAAISGAVGTFVSKYNSLMQTISSLSGYDAKTKRAGLLLGDSAARTITSGLRRILGEAVTGLSGPYTSLSQLGITTQTDGALKLDSSKLQAALDADPNAVARVFTAAGQPSESLSRGVADKLDSLLSDLLDSDGSLSSATDGVNARIKAIDKQREALSARLAALQDRYMKQFTAMDALIGQMKATSDYLTRQLASLPGVSSSSDK